VPPAPNAGHYRLPWPGCSADSREAVSECVSLAADRAQVGGRLAVEVLELHRHPLVLREQLFVPGEKIAAKYGRMMIPAFDFDSSELPPGVNSARHDKWAFDVIEFFPNVFMLHGNCWQNEITYWPIDARHTLIINQAWAYKAKNLGERMSRSYFRARVRDVFREDLNTLEAQQAALSTGVMQEVVLSRQEIEALSATARYYAPCFDVDSLMALQSTRNELMRAAATSAGAGYIDMNELLPGGTRYFGDAAHFTPAGEALAAQGLVNWLDGVTAVRAVLRAD
jgi:hypothetical protein